MARMSGSLAKGLIIGEMQEYPDLDLEESLWLQGMLRLAGIDEAGRGALAGPVTAAVVVLPAEREPNERLLCGVRDSKQMTAAEREHWSDHIRQCALDHAVGTAEPGEIDQLGIASANRLAMRRALARLEAPPDYLLIDYIGLPGDPTPQIAMAKGDARCLSIAAASILAKTHRDAVMKRLAGEYPGYGWARNKGYGTPEHLAALTQLGPTSVHRKSFAPLKPRLL